jgi:hypothetical protein
MARRIQEHQTVRMTQELDIANLDAGKSRQQLFAERLKRTQDAMVLKQPDRIPILLGFGNGLADFAGTTRREMLENAEKQNTCLLQAAHVFSPISSSRIRLDPR